MVRNPVFLLLSTKKVPSALEIFLSVWYNNYVWINSRSVNGRKLEIMSKKKTPAQRKARIIQSTVGVLCLAMLGFATVWAVRNATGGFDSSDIKTDAPASVSSEDSSSESSSGASDDTDTKSESSDDSKPDESAPDDSSAAESSQPEESSSTAQDPSSADDPDSAANQIVFPEPDDISDDFSDAVFIGNSRTVGLGMNCGKPLATFYASTGLNVETINTSQTITLDNGSKGTVYQALGQREFGRVFIMFGINEIGWPYWDGFESKYEAVIQKVRELQPNAKIYVQSVLPVNSLALSTNAVFTPANVDELNTYVMKAAQAQGAVYLDVNSALREADGSLPMDAAPTDGIHMVRKYCLVWLKYLADNT